MRWAWVVLSLATGCSLVTSLDGLSGGPEETNEAGAPDAAAPTDAATESAPPADADADPPLGPNLLASGDFEGAASICTDHGYNSNPTIATQAPHGGSNACRVCAAGTSIDGFTIDEDVDPTIHVGDRYFATAWVRRAAGASAPANGVYITLRAHDASYVPSDEKSSGGQPLTDGWTRIQVSLTITKPAPYLDVFVGADSASNACFTIDDIEVHRIP